MTLVAIHFRILVDVMAKGAANFPDVRIVRIGCLCFTCLCQLLVAAVAAQAGFHRNLFLLGFVAMTLLAADSLF